MRRRAIAVRWALALVIAGAAMATAFAGAVERHEAPRDLPPIGFDDRDGRTLSLAAFRGKVTVLHVWATWCASCRTEFPSLMRFRQAFAGRDVVLATVSVDRMGWPMVERTLKELDAEALPVYLDRTREIPSLLKTFGLPFSLVIDREGREIARIVGAVEWDTAPVTTLIDDALAK